MRHYTEHRLQNYDREAVPFILFFFLLFYYSYVHIGLAHFILIVLFENAEFILTLHSSEVGINLRI
jgi:hypothetical protein